MRNAFLIIASAVLAAYQVGGSESAATTMLWLWVRYVENIVLPPCLLAEAYWTLLALGCAKLKIGAHLMKLEILVFALSFRWVV